MSPPPVLHCGALLFDLDGVLADSTANVERHWRAWAVRHGRDAERLLALVHGRRAVDVVREVAPELDAEREVAALVAAEAGDTGGVVPAPGAAALLARLPADGWAVVTSGVRAVALARLRACGLPVPRLLVPADEVARGKPHPEGYLAAARGLGVPPDACLVLEDAPAGLAAAQAAGMRAVALATTHQPAALVGAELVVPSLAGLRVEVRRSPAGRPAFALAAAPG